MIFSSDDDAPVGQAWPALHPGTQLPDGPHTEPGGQCSSVAQPTHAWRAVSQRSMPPSGAQSGGIVKSCGSATPGRFRLICGGAA